jgi:hypothetical protein
MRSEVGDWKMTSIKALITASICLLAFSTPSLGADAWSPQTAYGPAMAGFEADLRAVKARAAAELPAKNPGVEVVEVPATLAALKAPSVLAPVLSSFEKALEAVRKAAKSDPTVAATLRARGLNADDVLAVGKTENGSLKILVEAA